MHDKQAMALGKQNGRKACLIRALGVKLTKPVRIILEGSLLENS